MVRSIDDQYLHLAYQFAETSPDPSTQNGAVLVDQDGAIGGGCNNFSAGVDSKYWDGEKEDKYARVVHAEMAAILDAGTRGLCTQGSVLICPWAACSNCAKHIVQAGVRILVRHSYSNNGHSTGSHWYADCAIGDEILQAGGVEIIEVPPLETSIRLRRNGTLWPAEGE